METEAVKLIAEGHSSREIAEILTISPETVDRQRTNILEKLNINDRVEVTRYAIRQGLGRVLTDSGSRCCLEGVP